MINAGKKNPLVLSLSKDASGKEKKISCDPIIILGIETSCDETAAAVYQDRSHPSIVLSLSKDAKAKHSGRAVSALSSADAPNLQSVVLSNELHSQISLHAQFGGVVPELASRSHLEKINQIMTLALQKAKIKLHDIDVIAVTTHPGLPGSLLIGLCFAKAIAFALNKPIIGINHLEGHAFSPLIENDVPFPHICLTASGGHTALFLIEGLGDYQIVGQTIDDAAGEAFDKIAKLLGLPYPGGPVIEKLAREMDFKDFYHYTRPSTRSGRTEFASLDFSFSGLKTAVLYDMVKRGVYDLANKKFLLTGEEAAIEQRKIASSLLVCIGDIFKKKLGYALEQYPEIKAITFAGGVACNKYLKQQLSDWARDRELTFFAPAPQYCTDNGAMIAFVGAYKAAQDKFDSLDLDI